MLVKDVIEKMHHNEKLMCDKFLRIINDLEDMLENADEDAIEIEQPLIAIQAELDEYNMIYEKHRVRKQVLEEILEIK